MILVSYFSASGVTEGMANQIANQVAGDLFEIQPIQKYTEEDLDWRNTESRSSLEMSNPNARPGTMGKVANLDSYSIVFLGFPVWWDKAPSIVKTFLDENDLKGKEIYVFVTSGGSGVDPSLEDLRKTYPDLNFVSGKRLIQFDQDFPGWL